MSDSTPEPSGIQPLPVYEGPSEATPPTRANRATTAALLPSTSSTPAWSSMIGTTTTRSECRSTASRKTSRST
jgi:hypothetical protein